MQAIEQFEISDRQALDRKLDEILKIGGEGLMLDRADALYTTGRSDILLKMKLWHDAEATANRNHDHLSLSGTDQPRTSELRQLLSSARDIRQAQKGI